MASATFDLRASEPVPVVELPVPSPSAGDPERAGR
jgi:hypothetical protein